MTTFQVKPETYLVPKNSTYLTSKRNTLTANERAIVDWLDENCVSHFWSVDMVEDHFDYADYPNGAPPLKGRVYYRVTRDCPVTKRKNAILDQGVVREFVTFTDKAEAEAFKSKFSEWVVS